MSNYKVKTQVPTEEKVQKRGGVLQAKGYLGSHANGPLSVYASLAAAPAAAGLGDGTPIVVLSGANAALYVTVSGAYRLCVS